MNRTPKQRTAGWAAREASADAKREPVLHRRSFLQLGGLAAAGSMLARPAHASEPDSLVTATSAERSQVVAPSRERAVVTPNGSTLPWRLVDGVKVGHLIAEGFEHEFAPGLRANCWGYNGSTPGPTIEAVEGDHVRIYVSNRLPEPTTVHWHGQVVPNGMDGIAGINQPPIPPGQTFVYEFTVERSGTFMYHSHFDEMVQIALGMVGMFVVHPRTPRGPRVDRDFALMTHEWKIDVGARRIDPLEMSDFNLLTFNSKVFPATQPLLVGVGERVRVRLGNLSPMEHHPIHVHGASFEVTETDGGYVPESARWPEATILVPVGSVRVIECVFEKPGDWAMHCHMTHHVMTQMGHGLPLMIGVDTTTVDRRMARIEPRYMSMGTTGMGAMAEMDMPIPPNSLPMRTSPGQFAGTDMSGMFTIFKVREQPKPEDVEGWYTHPPGTVAALAEPDRMRADGVEFKG